jgi:hypothetical protein
MRTARSAAWSLSHLFQGREILVDLARNIRALDLNDHRLVVVKRAR